MENGDHGSSSEELLELSSRWNVVSNKLLLLEYESSYCKLFKVPKFPPYYFNSSSGGKFHSFTTLSFWLLNKIIPTPTQIPGEYDDPNDTLHSLLSHIKQLNKGPLDVSVTKLKSGWGADVIKILDFLTTLALRATSFKIEPVVVESEYVGGGTRVEVEKEINLAQVEEEMAVLYEEEEKDDSEHSANYKTDSKIDELRVLESEMSGEEWQLELERVLPLLSQPTSSSQELSVGWKRDGSEVGIYLDELESVMRELRDPLSKLGQETKDSVSKIQIREEKINSSLHTPIAQLAASNKRVEELRERQKRQSEEINEKNRTLAKLTDEVESLRKKLEDRGTSMSDGAPVAQAKRDIMSLKKDISEMGIEIGVMEHLILKSMMQGHLSIFNS